MRTPGLPCTFVPPYLLERIAATDGDAAGACRETMAIDAWLRSRREEQAQGERVPPPVGALGQLAWTVHTADNGTVLPGRVVRTPTDGPAGDVAVDEAANGITGTLTMFDRVFGRDSFDGQGAPVSLTVHYGRNYDNAFWDGTQLVFGDGDGQIFERFTKPVDVLGHEFAHAVTEHTAGLVYRDQAGALNESVSDVFGSCLKQWLLDESAAAADWLIGEGLFKPGVAARALRDMRAPGTAYDDPRLGRDPQVGHMDDFVRTTSDNGGVHVNSGIPNRAFAIAATSIGGSSWDGAGQIWYAALTGGAVRPTTDFAGFAAATVAAAGDHADLVRDAWSQVGVSVGSSTPSPGDGSGGSAPDDDRPGTSLVAVRRTGGLVGQVAEGSVDLDTDDPRVPEVRGLVDRIDLAAVAWGPALPDMYVYAFDVCGQRGQVPELRLTDDLRRLAGLLLDPRQ